MMVIRRGGLTVACINLLLGSALPLVTAEGCYYNSTCVPINTSMCLTTKVTFKHTSLVYTNDTLTQNEILEQLDVWRQLQGVPECWNLIQPYLCSVYLPKCDEGNQKVEMPNKELCERVREPCEVVKHYNGSWPWFLQCDQWFYAQSCGQTVYETSNFDTSSSCSSPLIDTSLESNWYEQIKGCGVQCETPLFTKSQHETAHIVVAVLAGICLLCTLFTLVTFMLDWKVARKYPAVILFYINGCFFVATLGWLAQFISREDVICRKDGTIRKGEPLIGSGETASCTVVFILIYYFVMAAVVWFVMLAYSWDIHFKALGTVRDDLSKKTAYFHITSWCLPLVLTIVCLSISVIDADSLSGICFPGFYDSRIRTGFVIAPIGFALIVGAFFSIRGLLTLIKVKKDSPPFIGEKATAKIHDTIIRLGVFIVLTFILVIVTTSIHVHTFVKSDDWNKSLMDFTYCKANVSVMQILDNAAPSSCEMESRPNLSAALIHVFAFFFTGIVFSSWSWTKASLEVWERLYRRICNKPSNRPQRLRKHRLVARAFKRQKKRSNERLSISYGTDHDDPVGMRFDRSSASSHSQSSGFAVSMPKHSRRHLRSMMRPRRSRHRHVDSDAVSLGSRHSRSSRRKSYESSMSQKLSDIEREIREEERRKRRRKRRKKRQNRIQPILEPISSNMAAIQAHRLKKMNRRIVSDSSDVSSLSAQPTNLGLDKNFIPMQSLGSSNILSDSVTTGNSISEIELPQVKQKLPDFSIFTTQAALAPTANKEENKEDNSNGNTSNLKGANPSPSGSYRRGRRREVKLEMTETSFYQEDEDNIEMGGNQTIHTEENCRETGEIRGNLKELGPLVNEIFEQARANSVNSRNSTVNSRNSSHRDVMGSGRLGSASSRGSKGSRGSQSMSKDIKYATTKVNLPPEVPRPDSDRTDRKRPFSGNYVLDQRINNAKRDEGVRKSQSQPGSRVSSATNHKRQIGHNGRLDSGDGLSWSRFLHTKGHAPGQLFDPMETLDPNHRNFYNPPIIVDKGHGPYPGQLQITDKSHFEMQDPVKGQQETAVLNLEQDRKQNQPYEMQRPYTNPYRKYETMGDVLPDDADAEDSGISSRLSQVQTAQGVNILNVEAEHCKHCGAHKNYSQNVDLLNVQEEQSKSDLSSEPTVNLDMLNVEEEHRKHAKKKPSSPSKAVTVKKGKEKLRQSPKKTRDVLNIEEEHRNKLGKFSELGDTYTGNTNVLNVDQEQLKRARHGDVLANEYEVSEPVRDKQCQKVIEQIERPHTGPGPANDDQPKVRGKHEIVSAFSGKGQKNHVVPNRTKTVATLNSNVMNDTKSKGKLGSNSVPIANMNVLTLEQQRQQLKQKLGSQGSLSSRSASRSGSATTGSASSRNSRLKMLQQNGPVPPELNKNHSNSKINKIINQKPASGLERNLGMFDFIDYEEFNSEYDDITTDDLTDTYTYTDYDDDLTEVSSLPC